MKLFIFGSTGDLVKRKVLPALQSLKKRDLEVWALGRRNFTKKDYKNFVCADKLSNSFRKKIHYIKINFEKEDICSQCLNLFDKIETNYIYIALPPSNIDKILLSLIKIRDEGFKIKILIEKPFGDSIESALKLKDIVDKNNLERDIFLSDHYLFKENIPKNIKNFKKIEFISLEKLGLENRITYYDKTGALKDMVQNHFLHLFFKLTGHKNLQNFKIQKFVRAQYGDGKTKGYVKELRKKSDTETCVYLEIEAQDKTIIFFTGKKFSKKEAKLKIDSKTRYLKSGEEYKRIFADFFKNKKDNFPTINDTINAWKVIEKIEKKKPKLKYYEEGISHSDFLKLVLNIKKQ